MTPKFAIFYADDSIYEGGGENDELVPVTIMVSRDFLNAPPMRALAAVVEDKYVCRQVHRGGDFIIPLEDGKYGCTDSLIPWLIGKLGGVVKIGEYVSNEKMSEVAKKIKAYTRIPRNCDKREPFPVEKLEEAPKFIG